jgi:hypothetical protein
MRNPRVTSKPFSTDTGQAAVPEFLRHQIRALWSKGAKPDELAATFNLPLKWVEDFILEGKSPRSIN